MTVKKATKPRVRKAKVAPSAVPAAAVTNRYNGDGNIEQVVTLDRMYTEAELIEAVISAKQAMARELGLDVDDIPEEKMRLSPVLQSMQDALDAMHLKAMEERGEASKMGLPLDDYRKEQEFKTAKIAAYKRGLDFMEFDAGTVRQLHVSPNAIKEKKARLEKLSGKPKHRSSDKYPELEDAENECGCSECTGARDRNYQKYPELRDGVGSYSEPTMCLRDPRMVDEGGYAKISLFNELHILGSAKLVDSVHAPLPGGTAVYIETSAKIRGYFRTGEEVQEIVSKTYSGCGGSWREAPSVGED